MKLYTLNAQWMYHSIYLRKIYILTKEIRPIYFSEKAETTPFSIFWPGPEILLIIYLVTSVTTLLRILIIWRTKREEVFFNFVFENKRTLLKMGKRKKTVSGKLPCEREIFAKHFAKHFCKGFPAKLFCKTLCKTFSAKLFLQNIFCETFSAKHFLQNFLQNIYVKAFLQNFFAKHYAKHFLQNIFAKHFLQNILQNFLQNIFAKHLCEGFPAKLFCKTLCKTFSAKLFLQNIFCKTILQNIFCKTFSAKLFLQNISCKTFCKRFLSIPGDGIHDTTQGYKKGTVAHSNQFWSPPWAKF